MFSIKAIAFDFLGVLVKENDVPLSLLEAKLESQFGVLDNDHDYYQWAARETGLAKEEIERIVVEITKKRCTIREPDIFEKLPLLKFASATNHITKCEFFFNWRCQARSPIL